MDAFQSWVVENIGLWVVEYSALILVIATALLLILLLTFIIVACRHAHNNKKFRKLKAELAQAETNGGISNADSGAAELSPEEREQAELRIRAEIEESIRTEYETQYLASEAQPSNADVSAYTERIAELTSENEEKQRTIDALNDMLSGDGIAAADGDASALRAELDAVKAQKNEEALDFRIKISELREKNTELGNEINLLKAENAQIKAQALQQQLAQKSAESKAQPQRAAKPEKTEPAERIKQDVAAPKPKAEAKTVQPDDDDEYDEYYDDYGDENSAVKVTLKFDRIKQNWVILRTDTDRAYRRLATKQEALVIAKDLARRLHAQLVVHKKDGKFQRI